jgi:hypothetical protein
LIARQFQWPERSCNSSAGDGGCFEGLDCGRDSWLATGEFKVKIVNRKQPRMLVRMAALEGWQ